MVEKQSKYSQGQLKTSSWKQVCTWFSDNRASFLFFPLPKKEETLPKYHFHYKAALFSLPKGTATTANSPQTSKSILPQVKFCIEPGEKKKKRIFPFPSFPIPGQQINMKFKKSVRLKGSPPDFSMGCTCSELITSHLRLKLSASPSMCYRFAAAKPLAQSFQPLRLDAEHPGG